VEKTINAVIPAEVYVVEPQGANLVIDLKIGDQMIKAVTSLSLEARLGQQVWIGFDLKKIHIFDGKTEKTIY
jgi:ABC-type sugar transport system ATPase subunit